MYYEFNTMGEKTFGGRSILGRLKQVKVVRGGAVDSG